MKTKTKLGTILLALVMAVGMSTQIAPSHAEASEFYSAPENSKLPGTYRAFDIVWKLVSTKDVTAKGYAGGQSLKGVKFSTGGGFYWNENGAGPNISLSAGAYGFSVSVNLGTSSSKPTGKFVTVPNTKHHFKLYIEKEYIVKKYAVYGRPYMGSSGSKILAYYYEKELKSEKAYAVEQK